MESILLEAFVNLAKVAWLKIAKLNQLYSNKVVAFLQKFENLGYKLGFLVNAFFEG